MSDCMENMQPDLYLQTNPANLTFEQKKEQIASVLDGMVEETQGRHPKEFYIRDAPKPSGGYQSSIHFKLDGKIITSYGDVLTQEQKETLGELGYKIKIVEELGCG